MRIADISPAWLRLFCSNDIDLTEQPDDDRSVLERLFDGVSTTVDEDERDEYQIIGDASEGTISGLIARSADFYGNYRPFDMVRDIAGKLAKGRKAQLLLSDDKVHSLTYIPDAGRAVAALGQRLDAFNDIWHMPTDPDALTGAQLVDLIAALLGTKARHTVVPKIMLRMAGLFNRNVRGLLEMSYQFEQDYRFDSSKIARAFAITATPMRQGLAAHLAFLGHALADKEPGSNRR